MTPAGTATTTQSGISYGVGLDVTVSADTSTVGHTATLVVDASDEFTFLYDLSAG